MIAQAGSAKRLLARRALRSLAGVALLSALIAGRVGWGARREWSAAQAALAQRDVERGIVHLRRAASWYLPLAEHVPRALDALSELSRRAEAEGNPAQALSAERAIRAAIMGARSFYAPQVERLARADARIAQLSRVDIRARRPAPHTRANAPAKHVSDPSVAWSLLALAGWFAWMLAALALVTRGLDANSRLTPIAKPALLALGAGFLVFVLGLSLA